MFGTVGMQLFGGKINSDPHNVYYRDHLQGSPFAEANYFAANFNDLPSAFVTLFVFMVCSFVVRILFVD